MAVSSDKWYRKYLSGIAELYKGGAKARRHAYEADHRPRKKLPRPVISVGNLTVGGTGKTPVTIYLVNKLSGWCHAAILSRGYGRKNKRSYLSLPEASRLDDQAAQFFGDEPVMMAQHVKNASIHIGPNRYKTGLMALDSDPVDLFVLDDGFQHIELYRDLDIVILNGAECVRNLQSLPAGPLREPPETIKRADIVIINHCDINGNHMLDMDWLKKMCPDVPIVLSRYLPAGLIDVRTSKEVKFEELGDHPLFAFCGIAIPDNFYNTLKEAGVTLVGQKNFKDHHRYTGKEIRNIEEQAVKLGAAALITTEKDSVRFLSNKIRGLPIYYLKIKFQMFEGEEKMWETIGKVINEG